MTENDIIKAGGGRNSSIELLRMRPLSIYYYEDKLVQEALRRILGAVFEPMFYDEMMRFRPNRSCHKALKLLNTMIENNNTNYILDADIKGFFDNLDHDCLIITLKESLRMQPMTYQQARLKGLITKSKH